ncbi:bifunctional diguanylate cyclase/phosphodiesterase [Thalassotalea atypica]|uniref:bifunctional diguanylate cyclase/phosphodiesterase n=1 Tax=Thalassotalea atypica TaxID=2054316 RepID=UPI002572ACB1|nr:EAL domain-containing protein [Thalassotalea atypica]
MSLSKRLYLGLMLILTLVFIGTVWINVVNTSNFIEKQLKSHAQDTATSLGLSITPFISSSEDLPTVDAMVNAIFDNGYYQHVILTSNSGEVLLEKHNPKKIDGVPLWFVRLFPLSPPKASTEVFDGWVKPKTLAITSHPGFGYLKLWHSATNSFWMIFGLFIVAGTLVYLVLKTITQPIKRAALQADQICQGNFVQVNDIPKPVELNLFVNAMNRMSRILQNMFKELTQQTEKYQQFAFMDELTQFPNRRSFINQFDSILNNQEHESSGYLLIIRLSSLDHINKSSGYLAGDNYVLKAASIINSVVNNIEQSHSHKAYRIAGADFAVTIQEETKQRCEDIVNKLMAKFNESLSLINEDIDKVLQPKSFAHIGITPFAAKESLSDILAFADNALVNARHDSNSWSVTDQIPLPKGNTLWKEQLDKLLAKKEVDFAVQSVMDKDNTPLYKELYARFKHAEDNTPIPMGQLMSVAQRLNMTAKFDELVISKALECLTKAPENIAINLSSGSIRTKSFCVWLIDELNRYPHLTRFITFEISEQSLNLYAENVFNLCQKLKSLGCRITLEHFGLSTASFAQLMRVKPDFVKIDGSYSQQIETSSENQLFVQSLVNIAHSLHISVIGELIETESQKDHLKSLFVDNFQGFGISKPTPWF